MKNKKILFIILICVFIIVVSIFFLIRKNNTNNAIIKKGYELFGNEYCNCNRNKNTVIIVDGWPSYSTCKICGITKHNDAAYSDFTICNECAKITGRCSKCGKLLKK